MHIRQVLTPSQHEDVKTQRETAFDLQTVSFYLSSVCIYFMTDNKYWTSANWRTGYNPIFSRVVTRFSGRPVTHMLNRFEIQKKSNSLKWTPYGPTRNEFHTSYSSFVIQAIDNRINCGLSKFNILGNL